MGSWKGRGNQYIEFARVVYCKLPTNGKQLPAFPLEPVRGSNPGLRGGRRECYHSPTVAPCHPLGGKCQVYHNIVNLKPKFNFMHILIINEDIVGAFGALHV